LKIISLLSDFGSRDPYVAEMKAVMLSICPDVAIIDITHEIEKFNIPMGALTLAEAVRAFPDSAIHVAVVDPGVGGPRRPIIAATKRGIFVGPDNGLLMPAAANAGLQHVYHITNRQFMRGEISKTFHGRDIFAPAAACLALGMVPQDAGEEITDYTRISFEEAVACEKGVYGKVISVDSFGNVITNIKLEHLGQRLPVGDRVGVRVKSRRVSALFAESYYAGTRGPLLVIGSHGLLELALNQGNAAERFKVKTGDPFVIERSGAYR